MAATVRHMRGSRADHEPPRFRMLCRAKNPRSYTGWVWAGLDEQGEVIPDEAEECEVCRTMTLEMKECSWEEFDRWIRRRRALRSLG